ncbi:MAG: hypothetical protein ABSB35_21750 [Bryobacteraceae bacterium]|jgi:hypothetical protein
MKLGLVVTWLGIAVCIRGAATTPAPTACATPLTATTNNPTWDTSGNTMLKGTYSFRYVRYSIGDLLGNLSEATTLYGTITFTGTTTGTYTISNASEYDSSLGSVCTQNMTSPSGYSISASGFGFLSNPLPPLPSEPLSLSNSVSPSDAIWGTVSSSHVFIGSSTETLNGYNDLFIAAPQTNTAGLTGDSYSVAYINFPTGYVGNVVTAGFQMTPSSSSVDILMYQGNSISATDVVESVSSSSTSTSCGGSGALSFSGQAISGTECLYIAPNMSMPVENFIFGGSPTGFDFFVGVETATGTTVKGFDAGNFTGLYYQGGIDEIISSSGGSLQTYYGAFSARSGTILDHQRILAPLNPPIPQIGYPPQPFSNTYADTYTLAFGSNVGYTDTATGRDYALSEDGTMRLGFGIYPNLGISIALQAPAIAPPSSYSASQLYINPIGVVNAASFAPYTSGISPGELIVIFGSGFDMTTQVIFNEDGNSSGG